jgi:hypothetical protein
MYHAVTQFQKGMVCHPLGVSMTVAVWSLTHAMMDTTRRQRVPASSLDVRSRRHDTQLRKGVWRAALTRATSNPVSGRVPLYKNRPDPIDTKVLFPPIVQCLVPSQDIRMVNKSEADLRYRPGSTADVPHRVLRLADQVGAFIALTFRHDPLRHLAQLLIATR